MRTFGIRQRATETVVTATDSRFLFAMPGKSTAWPDWPEYTVDGAETGEDLVQYKKLIVEQYGHEALTSSWLKTCQELDTVTERISELGTAAVPVVQFEELFTLAEERKRQLKEAGCFKVAGVVAEEQATEWFHNLKEYVAMNKQSIRGRTTYVRVCAFIPPA